MSDPTFSPPENPLEPRVAQWGPDDPVYRTLVMLLNGYGYNWYRLDNQMRADDLLIRSRASDHLAEAASRLSEHEARYRRNFLPPPTRARPDADPEHLAAARRLHAAADRIRDIDTRLRGAAVPPDDKVWNRHRNELDMLRQVSECDVALVGATKALARLVEELPADGALAPASEQQIDHHLAALATALHRRNDILAGLP